MESSAAAPRVCGCRPAAPPGFGSRRTHRRRALRGRRFWGDQQPRKEENLAEDIVNLRNEMHTKLDTMVDYVVWKEANDDLDVAIQTVRDMVSSLRLDADARRREADEILATIRHDIAAVEANLEESKAKTTRYIAQAVTALRGRIDVTANSTVPATTASAARLKPDLSKVGSVRSEVLSETSAVPASPAMPKEVNSPTVEPSARSAMHSQSATPATAASGASPSEQAAVTMVADARKSGAKVAGVVSGLAEPHATRLKPDSSKNVGLVHSEALSAPSAMSTSPATTTEVNSNVAPSAHSAKIPKSAMPDLVLRMNDVAHPRQDNMEAGDLVELHGLLSLPSLNGARAVLMEYRAEKDQWAAEMLDTSECLLLKSRNMTLIRKWKDVAMKKEAGWEEPDEG